LFIYYFLMMLTRLSLGLVLKTFKLIIKVGRNPTDLSREILAQSVLLIAEQDEEKLKTLVNLCRPSSEILKTLPRQGTVQLAQTLKSKSKPELLKKLKGYVEERKKAGEIIAAQIKSALE